MSNLLLQTDVYKFGHKDQYPPKTNKVYSYLESRGSREDGLDYTVFFGLQYYLKKYLRNPVTHDDVDEYEDVASGILGKNNINVRQFRELADLGYIPLKIKAVPEGTVCPLKNALMTITNTHDDFAWLVNYTETLLMNLWLPITVASNSYRFRRMFNGFADRTVGNRDHVPFQMHDFGYRGCGSEESAAIAGAAHLLSFLGTDTTAAVCLLRDYYHGKDCHRPIGLSVPASEHSVMCAWDEQNDDLKAIKNMLATYPTGIVSIVSDTYNLWKAIEQYYCYRLKDQIMARDGKVVVRPDSGDPPLIICGDPAGESESERYGVLRLLESGFGSTTNAMGFREIDPHIGCIYGDAIYYDRAQQILSKMAGMGFASNQIVFGSGGLLLNNWSRDTLKMAIKATYCEVDGKPRPIEKDPITDHGKRSKKGLLMLEKFKTELGVCYQTLDQCEPEEEARGELRTVYSNGHLYYDQNLDGIRMRLEEEETLPQIAPQIA
jgi:nicotinamide phosphoribosyltransferase